MKKTHNNTKVKNSNPYILPELEFEPLDMGGAYICRELHNGKYLMIAGIGNNEIYETPNGHLHYVAEIINSEWELEKAIKFTAFDIDELRSKAKELIFGKPKTQWVPAS